MEADKIKTFIEDITNITEISDIFPYISFEIPKSAKDTDVLIINDLDESALCSSVHLVEFRIIWQADRTAMKIKWYADVITQSITGFHKFGYTQILLEDFSRVFLNSDERFEMVLTYKIY